jgi:hypothetical protein
LDKLLLTLTALASLVMPVIGAEPIGPVLANPKFVQCLHPARYDTRRSIL